MRPFLLVLVMLFSSCVTSRNTSKGDIDKPFSDCLTPMMYGAVGDGKHDDTEALRKALYESDKRGKVLYFPSGYHVRVTATLNYYNNKYRSYTLNMLGCIPIKNGSYSPKEYGGIAVENGVSLFKSSIIRGSIERVCITGKRDLSVRFLFNRSGLSITALRLVINLPSSSINLSASTQFSRFKN